MFEEGLNFGFFLFLNNLKGVEDYENVIGCTGKNR